MNESQAQAVRYFSPSNDSLWRWTMDGEALVWADGPTIAFRQEVEAIVERLAPGGLPRFGAIALLLAACRDGWVGSTGRCIVEGYARSFSQCQTNITAGASQPVFALVAKSIRATLAQLDEVSCLPAELRQHTLAKAILAETVFEPGKKQLTPEQSAAVVNALAVGINPAALVASFDSEESLSQFARDTEALLPGLGRVDAESLALRARTGLDETIRPADVELSPALRTRALLAELSHDREYSGLARLAHRLMAAVHVPRSLHSREELPVGGVSDLSNRGPLDRLLISELANDSLTLAVRVALNEAMYLRRESPPHDPPHRRALLLDCGIRLWGIPRAFAIAAALAFAATTDPAAELSAFKAAGKKVERIDPTTRTGLIACMAALDPAPHPGRSLKAFLEAAVQNRDNAADAILITHPDVLSDPEFSAALSQLRPESLYVVTVDRDGQFKMFGITPAGRKVISEARLDLSSIFAGEAASSANLAAASDSSLPAILSVEPFPLRLPSILRPRYAIAADDIGLVGVTNDGRLLHWDSAGQEARQVTAVLPRLPLLGLFNVRPLKMVSAVFASPHEKNVRVVGWRPAIGDLRRFELSIPSEPAKACFVVDSVLCLICDRTIEAFSVSDGTPLASLALPPAIRWTRDRFFLGPSGWCALAFDGVQLILASLSDAVQPGAILVFEQDQGDGPLALYPDGTIRSGSQPEPLIHGSLHGAVPLGVSGDGNRLAIRTDRQYLLDLTIDVRWKIGNRRWADFLVGPSFAWSASYPAMGPGSYQGICVNQKQELCLFSNKGQQWKLTPNLHGECTFNAGVSPASHFNKFELVNSPQGTRYSLHVAQWADGSSAYIDSRRVLHLQSADPALPQVSMVLNCGPMAGWASDGRRFGPRRFLTDGEIAPSQELSELVHQFMLRLR